MIVKVQTWKLWLHVKLDYQFSGENKESLGNNPTITFKCQQSHRHEFTRS